MLWCHQPKGTKEMVRLQSTTGSGWHDSCCVPCKVSPGRRANIVIHHACLYRYMQLSHPPLLTTISVKPVCNPNYTEVEGYGTVFHAVSNMQTVFSTIAWPLFFALNSNTFCHCMNSFKSAVFLNWFLFKILIQYDNLRFTPG